MVNFTVCVRDNLTLKAPGECMAYLEGVADIANKEMEANKQAMAQAASDLLATGHSEAIWRVENDRLVLTNL